MADRAIQRASLPMRTNFAWNFAGKAVYAASRALLLVLIAKLGDASMVGQYALAFAVTTPVFMLADLDLRSVLATDTQDGHAFGHYFTLRLIAVLAAMVATGALAAVGFGAAAPVILLVGAAKAAESISDMAYALLQKHERMDRLGISLMLRGGLSLLAMGLTLWITRSLAWGCAALAAAWVLVMLCHDLPAARRFAPVRILLSGRDMKALLRLSLPLGAVLLLASLTRNLPNYFIGAWHGEASLGYFSSMATIMAAGSLAASALSQSANARLARLFAGGDTRGFVRACAGVLAFAAGLGAAMALAAALCGRQILALLYAPDYAAWHGVFMVVMLAALVSYAAEVSASALTAARRFRIQPVLCLGALACGLILNALLVPGMGLMGAALSVLAASALQLAGNLAALAWAVKGREGEAARRVRTDGLPAPPRTLSVESIRSLDSLGAAVVGEWRALLAREGSTAAFADPLWLSEWQRACGGGRGQLILLMRDGGELAAVFPFSISGGQRWRRASLMGTPQATHAGIACAPGLEAAAADAAIACLLAEGVALVRLAGLRKGSAITEALLARLAFERIPALAVAAPCPVLRASGRGFDAVYRRRFSSHAVKNARRDEKRLAELGEVTYRELTAADIPAAFALHDLRWRRKLDTSGFTSGPSRRLFTKLLTADSWPWRAMALGLWAGGRLIAFQYGFLCRGRALLYKSAHDGLYGDYAPGKMIKRQFIRRCLALGAETIDFGVGYEDYKAEWTDESDDVLTVTCPGRGLLPRAAFPFIYACGRLRDWAKCWRWLVLFKRNTLGVVRWWANPRHWLEAGRRAAGMAERMGAAGLFGRLLPGRPVMLPLRHGAAQAAPAVEAAGPADVDALSMMMGCAPENVMRRIYRQQRCFLLRHDGAIACAAWVGGADGRLTISGLARDVRLCAARDVALLLMGIAAKLTPREREGLMLLIPRRARATLGAAVAAGFGPEAHETEPDTERKGLTGIAAQDIP